jgi:hypothetical protein
MVTLATLPELAGECLSPRQTPFRQASSADPGKPG